MKTWILAAVMMTGVIVSAQEKKERPEPLKPEQRTELQVKKMTLNLDLNENQQKEVKKLLTEQNKKREEFKKTHKGEKSKKLTADERFAMQNKMLDNKIALKTNMKTVLTPAQFEKWDRTKHYPKRMHHKKGKFNKADKK